MGVDLVETLKVYKAEFTKGYLEASHFFADQEAVLYHDPLEGSQYAIYEYSIAIYGR